MHLQDGRRFAAPKEICLKSVTREFEKITQVFQEANETILQYLGLKLGTREEYAVEYLSQMQEELLKITGMTREQFVHGSGKGKSSKI